MEKEEWGFKTREKRASRILCLTRENRPKKRIMSYDETRSTFSQPRLAGFAVRARCSEIFTRISDGWARARRSLADSVRDCSFRHFTKPSKGLRARLSKHLDKGRFTTRR